MVSSEVIVDGSSGESCELIVGMVVGADDGADNVEVAVAFPDGLPSEVDGIEEGADATSVVVCNVDGSVTVEDKYTEPVEAVVVEYGILVRVVA